ncbi:MAG: GxxExxY protein [Candidatus Sulfotelmatobacter sp.]|jgi:GxxExxY protein
MSHGFSRIFTDRQGFCRVDLLLMDAQTTRLKHSELTEKIIGLFYDVYNELGHGFLESTYAEALVVALQESELRVAREVPVPVWFRGRKVGQYYADLIVEDVVLLELKAGRTLESAHEAQLLHYLRATEVEVGLLLNFGLRPQFRRLLFDNERKKIRENPRESVAKVSA